MTTLLTPEFVARAGLPSDAAAQDEVVRAWHARKTQIYKDMVAGGQLPARPGIARTVGAALDAGWSLAVASTSAEPSVLAILDHVVGPEQAARFALVLAGDVVRHKKPAPDIYERAAAALGADPGTTLVIEDSRNGLVAATGAGLTCLVTVSEYTAGEDFTEAALVVSSLGEIGGEATRVLQNRTAARPGDWVTLADLEACMASRAA
jgi:HAD superfamily hydrolase (TIGR01509 family)